MPHRILITTASGDEVLPTADAIFFTPDMSTIDSKRTQVYLEFFTDAEGLQPTTPTAGTVTVEASPMGAVYLPPPSGGVISAATVSVPTASYTVPLFEGRTASGKVTFAGITGAPYARVMFWRYD